MGVSVSPPDTNDPRDWLKWFAETDHEVAAFIRELISGVLMIFVIGLLLFAASGVWPPMVAVESPSMQPHMYRGDLIIVVEEHRFAPETTKLNTGVVTYRRAAARDSHRTFGAYGDVIVFDSNGDGGTPVIHRAHFWVTEGENWYDTADPSYVSGESCEAIPNCPAPYAGFITKGDNNPSYDQVAGISKPVRPSWIQGRAVVRIPMLGHVRLAYKEVSSRM